MMFDLFYRILPKDLMAVPLHLNAFLPFWTYSSYRNQVGRHLLHFFHFLFAFRDMKLRFPIIKGGQVNNALIITVIYYLRLLDRLQEVSAKSNTFELKGEQHSLFV